MGAGRRRCVRWTFCHVRRWSSAARHPRTICATSDALRTALCRRCTRPPLTYIAVWPDLCVSDIAVPMVSWSSASRTGRGGRTQNATGHHGSNSGELRGAAALRDRVGGRERERERDRAREKEKGKQNKENGKRKKQTSLETRRWIFAHHQDQTCFRRYMRLLRKKYLLLSKARLTGRHNALHAMLSW